MINYLFRASGLRALMGDDASNQAGDSQEVMLHETAVSWLRVRERETVPAKAWLETREQFTTRLKACCEAVNKDLDVEGMNRSFLNESRSFACERAGA